MPRRDPVDMPRPLFSVRGKKRARDLFNLVWDSPDAVLKACVDYFEWADNNPILKHKLYSMAEFGLIDGHESKPRVFSLNGLFLHTGIHPSSWKAWQKETHFDYDEERHLVVQWAEMIIYEQKYSHAMVGEFNSTMTVRDLGLVEKQEIKTPERSEDDSNRLDVSALTPQERLVLFKAMKAPAG